MRPRTLVLFIGATLAISLCGCSDSGSQGPTRRPPEDSTPPPEDPGESSPTLAVDDVTVHEDNGSVAFIVRIEGNGDVDEASVDFSTVDGSATAGSDYIDAAGTLQFFPATTEHAVTIDIVDDMLDEEEETFTLQLSNPLNAEIVVGAGVATILDSDSPAVCGMPDIDETDDRGAFLWKDCSSGGWQFRVAEAGAEAVYEGIISSPEAFVDVRPVATGSDDVVENEPDDTVTFSLTTSAGVTGFDFEVADDAGTCFDLALPADAAVLLGQSRNSVTMPFDLATLEACEVQGPPADPGQHNIVVLFTDDQRFDTLDMSDGTTDVMPNVKRRLLPKGVQFENAYVPIPLCCPARASTYSGGFLAQDTGVLDNLPPNGGMRNFDDSVNIGTQLQEAGYRTMFIGKWLNDYHVHRPYIPPGWDTFAGRSRALAQMDWSHFYYALGSTRKSSGVGQEINSNGQYHVYFERDQIIDFIDEGPDDEPYMVFWSTTAPHAPAIPDAQDAGLFSEFTYRGRGYGETDVSDKPRWVRSPGRPIGDDEEVRGQLRTLRSVDRAFGGLLDAITARGELDETVFIITSDNGYLWGEHGVWTKKKPYEESIKVPLLIVLPGIEPRRDRHLVSAVLDLGPTLYDIAGTSGPSQGMSLVPLLRNPSMSWRDELFVENYGIKPNLIEIWAGVRRDQWKYIKYWYGEEELYNLQADPFELENRVGDPAVAEVKSSLEARVDAMLGLAIHPLQTDSDGRVGQHYELTVQSWGGQPPLDWAVESGRLPPGLKLDAKGKISGRPTAAGSWTFRLRVTGSSLARQADRPQTYVSGDITIKISS